jgi:hypothetical protein
MENQKTYPVIVFKTDVGAKVRTPLIVAFLMFSCVSFYLIFLAPLPLLISFRRMNQGRWADVEWVKLLIAFGMPIFLLGLAGCLQKYVRFRYVCGACRKKVPRFAKICLKCRCPLEGVADSNS